MRKNIQNLAEAGVSQAKDRGTPVPDNPGPSPKERQRWLVAALLLFAAGCSSADPPPPDPAQAIAAECERAAACVPAGELPVSPAFCEQEARQIVSSKEQTCDQATLNSCASANAANDCDSARALATTPGGLCGDCWRAQ